MLHWEIELTKELWRWPWGQWWKAGLLGCFRGVCKSSTSRANSVYFRINWSISSPLWPWSDSLCFLQLAAKAYNNTSTVVFFRVKKHAATSQPLCVARPLAALFQIAPTISITWQYQHAKEIPSPGKHNRPMGITWIMFIDKVWRRTGARLSVAAPEVTAILSAQHGALWLRKHKRTCASLELRRPFLPKGCSVSHGQRPRKLWSLRPGPLNEPFSWNVCLNGQKLRQLTDTAKVNAHNLSHTHAVSVQSWTNSRQHGRQIDLDPSHFHDSDQQIPGERRGLAHIDRSTLLNVILILVTQQFQNEKIYILCSTPKYKPLTLLVLRGAGDGYNTNFRSDVVVKKMKGSAPSCRSRELSWYPGQPRKAKKCAIKFRCRRSSNWHHTFSGEK